MKAGLLGAIVVGTIGLTGSPAMPPVQRQPQSYTASQAPAPPAEIAAARAQLTPALVRSLDRVINASWREFDMRAAFRHVQFMSRYWRLPGNAGFDASIDHARTRLLDAGFADGHETGRPSLWIESYQGGGKGWDYSVGTLALTHTGQPEEILLSREMQHIALCYNSFSTPIGGVTTSVIDVGRGDRDQDYAGAKGAVVLGDSDVEQLWQRATAHGAVGVISTSLGDYVNPDLPNATAKTPRDEWDILQWGGIPYDDSRKGFAFKASPRAAATLRRAIARGAATVHVTIVSTFSNKPARMLIAEIPGRTHPDERVVVVAHVQEPGASDNASGVATLTELARGLIRNLARNRFAGPDRTLTFMWLDEVAGSHQWMNDHKDEAAGVKYMFSMDMVGEDVTKTGGAFLIERYPDPAAVWQRPWDPHSEWGSGDVRADQLHGDLINDLHLAVCERVATRSNWVVRSNPYEGGSDHTVYGQAGVPSLLNWHFTDRYYHTSFDTPDKVSVEEMRNVGVAVTTSVWLFASANEAQAIAVADLVSRTGQARVLVESRDGARLAQADADPTAAQARETTIVQAWRKWYAEAVESVHRLVVGPTSPQFDQKVTDLAAPFQVK